MTKDQLLEAIETAHRQLERYIFFFAQDEGGLGFFASDRPKFSREEMLQPGVWGEWSLKDLLANILQSEQRVSTLLENRALITIASPLLPSLKWEQRLDPEHVPDDVQETDLDEVLGEFSKSYQSMEAKLQ